VITPVESFDVFLDNHFVGAHHYLSRGLWV
jgi:hypothetical protein